jgi:hypothetical protein
MSAARKGPLVLAVHPFTRGIAFTLFESPLSPVDWGVKSIRGNRSNLRSLEMITKLIERLQPDVLVLEDIGTPSGHRAERIRRLHRLFATHARGQSIELHRYTRREIRASFAATGAKSRYEIAQTIASHVHALEHRLPPVRKLWTTEDSRMGLFDAASLVMTYYCRHGRNPITANEGEAGT